MCLDYIINEPMPEFGVGYKWFSVRFDSPPSPPRQRLHTICQFQSVSYQVGEAYTASSTLLHTELHYEAYNSGFHLFPSVEAAYRHWIPQMGLVHTGLIKLFKVEWRRPTAYGMEEGIPVIVAREITIIEEVKDGNNDGRSSSAATT